MIEEYLNKISDWDTKSDRWFLNNFGLCESYSDEKMRKLSHALAYILFVFFMVISISLAVKP